MKVNVVKLSEIFPYYDNPRDNTNALNLLRRVSSVLDTLSLSSLIRQV